MNLDAEQTCNFVQILSGNTSTEHKIKRSSCKKNFSKIGNLLYDMEVFDHYLVNANIDDFTSPFDLNHPLEESPYWEKLKELNNNKVTMNFINECLGYLQNGPQYSNDLIIDEKKLIVLFYKFIRIKKKFLLDYHLTEEGSDNDLFM